MGRYSGPKGGKIGAKGNLDTVDHDADDAGAAAEAAAYSANGQRGSDEVVDDVEAGNGGQDLRQGVVAATVDVLARDHEDAGRRERPVLSHAARCDHLYVEQFFQR
jgi:hypothetical protein